MTARIVGPTAYADAIGATSVTGPSMSPRYRHPYDPAVSTPTHRRSETTDALASTLAGVTAAQRAKQRANSATCATVSVMNLLPRRRDAIVAARSPTPHSAGTPNPRTTVAPPLLLRACRLRPFRSSDDRGQSAGLTDGPPPSRFGGLRQPGGLCAV